MFVVCIFPTYICNVFVRNCQGNVTNMFIALLGLSSSGERQTFSVVIDTSLVKLFLTVSWCVEADSRLQI